MQKTDWPGLVSEVLRPLFPGYLFAWANDRLETSPNLSKARRRAGVVGTPRAIYSKLAQQGLKSDSFEDHIWRGCKWGHLTAHESWHSHS